MEWKKPRGYDKNNMLYPDRCMMKWHGMILSDHNERMEEEKSESELEKDQIYYSEQELEVWDTLIARSLFFHAPIKIRINHPNEKHFYITGVVEKVKDRYISVREGIRLRVIHKSEIDEICEI